MILQALHDFTLREELVDDLDFKWYRIAYQVRIGRDGELLGIRNLKKVPEVQDGKKKPRKVAPFLRMPRERDRASGDRAFFLYDKAEYIFGIDPDGKRPAKKLANRSRLFRERVRQASEATGDEALGAAVAFLDRVASGEQEIELDDEVASNDLFALYYRTEPKPITDRPGVRRYWKKLREAKTEARICLVTGKLAPSVELHTALKQIPGAKTAGVPLVSFNQKAFESYGLDRNENAPISRDAAETIADGLQRLLDRAPPDPNDPGSTLRKQNYHLNDDTVVVYWTSDRHGIVDSFGEMLEGDLAEVENLLRSPYAGRPAPTDDPVFFYALILSGAQGRAIVRSWFETTVAELETSLARHFRDLELVRNTPKPKNRDLPTHLSLRDLLRSLAPPGKTDRVPSTLAAQLLAAAMRGTPYPISILQRAVQRFRAETARKYKDERERREALKRCDARAALIKAVLNRRIRNELSDLPEVNVDMDPENTQPGYLLGRLMAVLESLQRLALGEINTTVIDRYFSAASTTPRIVFVQLLNGARHHAKKAKSYSDRKGHAIRLERQIDEILSKLEVKEEGFEPRLDLEQQGLFVLGYHQQRHELFPRKNKKELSTGVD